MPLKKIEIDPDEFQSLVTSLENQYTFHSPSDLWGKVSEVWTQRLGRQISPRTIYARAKEYRTVYYTRLRRNLINCPIKPRVTERVDYLYRCIVAEPGSKRLWKRDLRWHKIIRNIDDIEAVESIVEGELWGLFRYED